MVTIIAAMGKNREIGFKGNLPWNLPAELNHFREVTRGCPVVMGRRTHEAIGRVLPGRKNIIVTRDNNYHVEGCITVNTIEDALAAARDDGNDGSEIFIIGGAEIYKLALPYAQKMILTFVDANPEADTYFPEFNEDEWRETKSQSHQKDVENIYDFTIKTYERKQV
jgi:dihydrofolate reductase